MSEITIKRYTLLAPPGQTAPWLDCRVCGPEDAPVLLFLHGFPEAAFVWDELLRHFGDRYHCVAPNLRGYASSFSPQDPAAYRAQSVAMDLVQLVQQIHAPAAAVVAHDWGGAIAWGLAAMLPQLMQRLVILNSPHPALFLQALRDDPQQQQASAYMNLLRQAGVEDRLQADDFAMMWPFFEQFGGAPWLTPALRQQYREVWSAGLSGAVNYYRASPLHPPESPQDPVCTLTLPDNLTHVRVPTTVVWGEADTALPPSLLDGLDQYVSTLKVVRLPGATHWLVHEMPERVAREIDAALRRSSWRELVT